MSKQHDVQGIHFEAGWMILAVDGQVYRLPLAQISKRLAIASEAEQQLYRVSPSGYGIHWVTLDEDLSINGLIKLAVHLSQEAGRSL
ncbi:MAG: DUF2442 domain-containing protein [Aphanocapsa sp. GSE-SYN-MK-11-07L]|jgi:hypothetical protein|nr:DUF2442 domain-containing protein [Aphanocapsa sp. GSE-SYN-MK-11-07L]